MSEQTRIFGPTEKLWRNPCRFSCAGYVYKRDVLGFYIRQPSRSGGPQICVEVVAILSRQGEFVVDLESINSNALGMQTEREILERWDRLLFGPEIQPIR